MRRSRPSRPGANPDLAVGSVSRPDLPLRRRVSARRPVRHVANRRAARTRPESHRPEHGAGRGTDDHVAGVVDARVDPGERDGGRGRCAVAGGCRAAAGRPRRRRPRPTPSARTGTTSTSASAPTATPGRPDRSGRVGRRRRASFIGWFTAREVMPIDGDTGDRREPPAWTAEHGEPRGDREPRLGVVGRIGDPPQRDGPGSGVEKPATARYTARSARPSSARTAIAGRGADGGGTIARARSPAAAPAPQVGGCPSSCLLPSAEGDLPQGDHGGPLGHSDDRDIPGPGDRRPR